MFQFSHELNTQTVTILIICEPQGAGKKLGGKAKRTLAPDNVKRSDIAPWDRNDKKASWQAWKMQTRRMLKDSNISEKRQVSFVLSALQGGSASAVLASWGPEGPPSDISIGSFWNTLDTLFAPEESNLDRDNRLKRFKLGDFPSIEMYLERYQDEMAKYTFPPSEGYRLGILSTAIQEIPALSFHMEHWLSSHKEDDGKDYASGTAFAFMYELRKCERLVPKKAATQSVAAVSSEEAEENLAQRLATRVALIQGKSGRFKNDPSSAKKPESRDYVFTVGRWVI